MSQIRSTPENDVIHAEELDVFVAELRGAVRMYFLVAPGPTSIHAQVMVFTYICRKKWTLKLLTEIAKRFEQKSEPSTGQANEYDALVYEALRLEIATTRNRS